MAEVTLKDLSGALGRMAEEQRRNLIPDVHDIREAVCEKGRLLDQLSDISTAVGNIEKTTLANLAASGKKKDTKPAQGGENKELMKHINSIDRNLSSILGELKKHKGGSGDSKILDNILKELKNINKGLRRGSIKDIKLDRRDSRLNLKKDKKDIKLDRRDSRLNLKKDEKDTKTKKKELGRLGESIAIIKELKEINLKDIITSKLKIKFIGNIMDSFREKFKAKDKKDFTKTLEMVKMSIDMIKELASIGKLKRAAKKGKDIIELIIVGKGGKGGLLESFKIINSHKKDITDAKKQMVNIKDICDSMLLVSMALTGILVFTPTALLGTVAMAGITILLGKTFKYIGSQIKEIKNGGKAIRELGLGILAFGVGMLIMKHAIKDVSLKDVLIMAACISVAGLAVAAIGKLNKHIEKGSIAIAAMGAGLLVFSLGLNALKKSARGLTLKDVGIMAATIVGTGLAVAGVGLAALPISIGSGVLLLMGISLGLFALALKPWTKFDSKPAMENIKTAVSGLREAFGLNLGKTDSNGKKLSFGKRIGKGIMGFISGVGDALSSMGNLLTILMTAASLGVLRSALKPWIKFDAKPAISNIKNVVTSLKTAFNDKKLFSEGGDIKRNTKGINKAMKSIRPLLHTMNQIRRNLKKWDDYDGKKAITNIKNAVTSLKTAFNDKELASERGDIKRNTKGINKAMKSIKPLLHTMNQIRRNLKKWDDFDANKSVLKIRDAITKITAAFNSKELVKNAKGMKRRAKGVNKAMESVRPLIHTMDQIKKALNGWDEVNPNIAISKIRTTIDTLISSFNSKPLIEAKRGMKRRAKGVNKAMESVQPLLHTMSQIKNALTGWDEIDPTTTVTKIKSTISALITAFNSKELLDENKGTKHNAKGINKAMKSIKPLLHTMNHIRLSLKKWDEYDGKNAVNNIKNVVASLISAFNNKELAQDGRKVKHNAKGIDKAMESIQPLLHTMNQIRHSLRHWDEYDGKNAVNNIKNVVTSLISAFNNKELAQDGRKTKRNTKGIDKAMESIQPLLHTMNQIRHSLRHWDEFDGKKAVDNIKSTINELKSIGAIDPSNINSVSGINTYALSSLHTTLSLWNEKTLENANILNNVVHTVNKALTSVDASNVSTNSEILKKLFYTIHKTRIQKRFTSTPIKDTVNAVNALDMSKANMMIGMFKSFAKVKERRPFEDFKSAVDRFVDACKDLSDTFSSIESSNTNTQTTDQNVQPSVNQETVQTTSTVTGGMTITNVQELAEAIAQKMKTMKINLDPSMLDINLVAESISGRSVKLTLLDY